MQILPQAPLQQQQKKNREKFFGRSTPGENPPTSPIRDVPGRVYSSVRDYSVFREMPYRIIIPQWKTVYINVFKCLVPLPALRMYYVLVILLL